MATAAAIARPVQNLLTSEEFLDWLEPGVRADLIGGEVFVQEPSSLRHERLLNFVFHLLSAYAEHENLGEVHRSTVAVRLSLRETFLPDMSFYVKPQVARFPETHVPFAPLFALEILSPTTAHNDTGRKFAAYELHGVQEYWILDPQKLAHRFYRRAGDMFVEFAADAERIDSASLPGFWVKRAWLNPEQPPAVSACLAEILKQRRPRGRGK